MFQQMENANTMICNTKPVSMKTQVLLLLSLTLYKSTTS